MKILVLSFYYPPDLCAGSFRTAALINALEVYKDKGLQIDLITTQPNRYIEMATVVDAVEDYDWLNIRRVHLPTHQSGMLDQAKAFYTYAKSVRSLTSKGDWDLVFATSSRLMTAALGAEVSRCCNAPLYLDIRDLFIDTMNDVLSGSALRRILTIFRLIEKRTFRQATKINLVSEGFKNDIQKVVPNTNLSIFTNGIDGDFLKSEFQKIASSEKLPTILYAGNIGAGQGLHHIIPKAAKALSDKVRFKIIGNGGQLNQLKSALKDSNINNVDLIPAMSRSTLLDEYKAADILFLHLNKHPAFEKVLPSKIFEYAATGKPIIAGVAGYAADFLRKEIPDAQMFDPCDELGMLNAINTILSNGIDYFNREQFCVSYNREKIMERMAADIIHTISMEK